MLWVKFAKALLVIAIGLLACWAAARADSIAESAPDNLFDSSSGSCIPSALGALTFPVKSIAQAASVYPFSFSGAWAASFSNLNLPAVAYWELAPDSPAPASGEWAPILPPVFDTAAEAASGAVWESNSELFGVQRARGIETQNSQTGDEARRHRDR